MKKILEWFKSLQFAKVMCAILTLGTMGLFAWGAYVPPPGVVDGSLLKAGGILLGFAALWVIAHIVVELDKSGKVKVSKDGVELSVTEEVKQ